MKVQGKFKMQALTFCDDEVMSTRTAAGQFKCQFKGAMEELSQKVQNANTHTLRRQNHEHAHSSRSVQGSSMGQWMTVQCKFKMQAHIISAVVMDIAAFKVSHSGDKNATAL
jgi:hypothetical protein